MSDFTIFAENIGKAAEAVRALDLHVSFNTEDDTAYLITVLRYCFSINTAFDGAKLTMADGGRILFDYLDCFQADLEQLFKAISSAVVPGSYVDFMLVNGNLTRYVFLSDAVERLSAPVPVFKVREFI